MSKANDQGKILDKANEVAVFLMTMRTMGLRMPYDDFAYGEALWRWEIAGKPSTYFFSTEDPFLLKFQKELTTRFGLVVLTRAEGEAREKLQPTKQVIVDGFPRAGSASC